MKLLIQNGRVIDPASGFDQTADVAIAAGRIVAIGQAPADFIPNRVINAQGCIVAPGLVDLAARLREPGQEHAGMLESEMAAAVAGGVTSLVCPPDTEPVLDEPGLVEMLRYRAEKLHQARVLPLGALTVGLKGDVLTEMGQLQYASTFGFTVWLRPQELHLGKGVAASGALATRMGLSGVSVAAETIALHTIFELVRSTRARVHLCRISSAQGVELVRQAKAEGLPVTADVSINSLHLTDADMGYFDSRARLTPVLRQQRDRDALRAGLADGTIDVLVSDHTPVDADAKALPFAEAVPGATGMELLWSLALKWGQAAALPLPQMLSRITADPARVLGTTLGSLQDSVGHLAVGGVADVCVLSTEGHWLVCDAALRSQGKSTPFSGYELPGRVRATVVGGQVAFEA
jgi:dihydroorotase